MFRRALVSCTGALELLLWVTIDNKLMWVFFLLASFK